MTDMDYEKKYKEALTWVESIYHELSHDRQMEAEAFFPELKESEDEKIRKEILSFCQGRADNYPNAPMYGNIRKWIAWLEKQGQKPYGQRKECLDCQFNYVGDCKGSCAMKRNEQNHVDKAEPKFRVGDEIITKNEEPLTITRIDEKGYWSNDLFICDFDSECVWDLVEQKSAWSEEDEKYIAAAIELVTHCSWGSFGGLFREDVADWLKSLKPQPKQVWSEDDEKFFKTALWHISYSISNGESTDIHCDTTEWIKSLKQRIGG